MKKTIYTIIILLTLAFLLNAAEKSKAQAQLEKKYVVITSKKANLYYSPSVTSEVVVDAEAGNVFEVKGENNAWYSVAMFSDQYRYLPKENSATFNYQPQTPPEDRRKEIFKSYQEIEQNSKLESGRVHKEDYRKFTDLKKMLDDRVKFRVIRQYGYQMPDIEGVNTEGNQKYWW